MVTVKFAQEQWLTANVCQTQRCSYDAAGQAQIVDVPVQCPSVRCDLAGWSLKTDPNECCERCVQTQCVFQGALIAIGATERSSDGCSTFTCTNVNGSFIIETVPEKCPNIATCPTHLRVQKGCCVECKTSSLMDGEFERSANRFFYII